MSWKEKRVGDSRVKLAILSDIHGNLEAFEAVYTDLVQQGAERVVSLGDNIGYGPNPEEVVCRLQQLGCRSVLGNHEFALMDIRGRRWLNFQAAENNIETEKLLSDKNKIYCCNLPPFFEFEGGYFVHAYPPDSVFRYLDRQDDQKIAKLFEKLPAELFFLGHTHRLQLVAGRNGKISRRALGQELLTLKEGEKYIVNCGSVGQPRDGDNRAKYLLWDCDKRELEVRFVEYDITKTMQKILDLGFPEVYALRLR